MKYTDKAKWIVFPSAEVGAVKHYIESTSEIAGFDELLIKSIEQISKYENVKRKE